MKALVQDPFALTRALLTESKTVIVEGFTGDDEELSLAKSLDASTELRVPVKNQPCRIYETPDFIFCQGDKVVVKGRRRTVVKPHNFISCSGNKNPIKVGADDRRFTVIFLTR